MSGRQTGQGYRSLSRRAVAEEYDAVSESALIAELEVGARVGRQRRLAATDDHGPHEQLALVNQAGLESLRREVCTSYGEIAAGRGLQLVYRGGVEVAFEPGVGGRPSNTERCSALNGDSPTTTVRAVAKTVAVVGSRISAANVKERLPTAATTVPTSYGSILNSSGWAYSISWRTTTQTAPGSQPMVLVMKLMRASWT